MLLDGTDPDRDLVQIIYCGANGVIDPADSTQPGYVGGDDTILRGDCRVGEDELMWGLVGDGEFTLNMLGVEGALVYARIWNASTIADATHYGDSEVCQLCVMPNPPEDYYVASFSTNQVKPAGATPTPTITPTVAPTITPTPTKNPPITPSVTPPTVNPTTKPTDTPTPKPTLTPVPTATPRPAFGLIISGKGGRELTVNAVINEEVAPGVPFKPWIVVFSPFGAYSFVYGGGQFHLERGIKPAAPIYK